MSRRCVKGRHWCPGPDAALADPPRCTECIAKASEPVPSKDKLAELRRYHAEIVESDGAECEAMQLTRWAIERIERLQTALRGIQSCSTCSACRGAATLALRDRCAPIEQWNGEIFSVTTGKVERYQQPPKDPIRALVESAYKDGYGGDLTDDRDLSARTLEMMRRMSVEPSAEQVLERGRQVEAEGLRLRHRVAKHPVPRTGYVLVWHEDKGQLFPTAWHARCYHNPEIGANLYPPAVFWETISPPDSPPPPEDDPRPLWRNDRCQSEGCINPPVDGLFCAKHPEGRQG